MVQAIISINEHANRIINIVKAKYDLKDKSQAIELITEQYEEEILEPKLRPEYVEKVRKIMKQNSIMVGSAAELRQRYEK